MQHDEAASAANTPPTVRSLWVRRTAARLASGRARLVSFSAWLVINYDATSCSHYRIKRNFSMPSVAPLSPAALSIGELSRRTGVNIETIRYYARIEMLPAPPRTASGRRVYGPAETRSLTFIRRSRELGFTLDEVRALLALSAKNGQDACAEVRDLAARHLGDVR